MENNTKINFEVLLSAERDAIRASPYRGSWLGEAQTDEVKANKFFQQKNCENRFTSSEQAALAHLPLKGKALSRFIHIFPKGNTVVPIA